jgi:uncharacterized membrane protein
MEIDKLIIKLEKKNYVVKYKSIAGNNFEKNIIFLVESLIKPLIIVINSTELTDKIEEIINKYNIKRIIIENKQKDTFNNYDKFYLNY